MKPAAIIKSLLLLELLIPRIAFADCPILQEVLEERSEDLSVFSARNAQMMASVLQAEKDCHEQGAKISARIAKAADSLSCQAQADAAEMNREMEEIGRTCTTAFQKRHELQTMLHNDFNQLLADVDDGVNYIVKSDILNEDCAEEVHVAKKLYKASHVTEGNIVATELRALGAMNSYEKFRETSELLKRQTLARNGDCGIQPGLPALPPLPTGAPGQGSPTMVAGVTPKDASDITGRIQNLALSSGESEKIDHMKFPRVAEAAQGRNASQVTGAGAGRMNAATTSSAPSSPVASALEVYTKPALLPQKLAGNQAEPASTMGSTVLAVFSMAEAAEESKGEAKEVANGEAEREVSKIAEARPARSPASLSPAHEMAPLSSEVKFIGELSAAGEAKEASPAPGETSLFERVQSKYRVKELSLNPKVQLKAELSR